MGRRTSKLTHLSPTGKSQMVDVSDKTTTAREAVAAGTIRIAPKAMDLVREGRISKGNVVETARLAGIMAAKKTADLVPLCHPLWLDHVDVEITDKGWGFEIRSRVRCKGKTGVEMEALTAVSVAALTLYDMVKAADRAMVIGDIRLMRKSGGRSGTYVREVS
jgi:cyclic pyranopterin phosphate synthase